jgi:hypothetical protein
MSIYEKNHQYYTMYYILYTYFWPTLYKIAFDIKYVERINFYACSCNSESDVSLVSNNRDTKQMLSIVEPFGTHCYCIW